MNTRQFLQTILLGAILFSSLALNLSCARPPRKPNVVICFLDQMRSFELGCYGNSVIRTPNMDRLAEAGCRFELGVTNNPVCVPARACLLSGQYSRTSLGALGNRPADDGPFMTRNSLLDPTLAELLKEAGYHTALIGKWHLPPHPVRLGFDYALYPASLPHRYYHRKYLEHSGERGSLSTDSPREIMVEEFVFSFLSSKMQDYIRRHKDEPFFVYYNITLPNQPIGPGNMPDKYVKMYDRNEVPLRRNVYKDGVMAHDEWWFKVYTSWDYFWRSIASGRDYRGERLPDRKIDQLPAGFDLRDLTAYYYGATTCADDLVGELMTALEDNGIAEDTIVVLSSDHGENLGSHHWFNKDLLIEESIRVPMIFRYPQAVKRSVNRNQVASTIDIMPTILELCGLPVPEHVQGQSLVPILRQERESLEKNFAMIETSFSHMGIRTPSHMYGMEMPGRRVTSWPFFFDLRGEDQLYFFDLRKDPFQQNNLARTGEQSELAADLRRKLTDWDEATPWLRTSKTHE